ncbi:MAG: radical SAM protein [Euryarchaeota archaeon]|nr:radical SAM protein [Euryarchaeota archaeon]
MTQLKEMQNPTLAIIKNKKDSPDYVRLSLAAAMTLGYAPGKFYRDAKLYCINLLMLYGDGCKARCSYCGLSRARPGEYETKSFIRVDWPSFALSDVIDRITKIEDEVERICVSMITHPNAPKDLIAVIKKIREKTNIPISALVTPTLIKEEEMRQIKEAGVDILGIAVDCATEGLFDIHRGKHIQGPHKWKRYWDAIDEAVKIFGGGKVSTHLIVGLGETEKEIIAAIQRSHDLGAMTHLFSFFAEEDSPLAKHSQPPLGQYRRVQIARYLIDNEMARFENMKFNSKGQLISFGVSEDALNKVITEGEAFMTSGCPAKDGTLACNRPFANETPGQAASGEWRNYPFKPTSEDIEIVKKQVWDYSETYVAKSIFSE